MFFQHVLKQQQLRLEPGIAPLYRDDIGGALGDCRAKAFLDELDPACPGGARKPGDLDRLAAQRVHGGEVVADGRPHRHPRDAGFGGDTFVVDVVDDRDHRHAFCQFADGRRQAVVGNGSDDQRIGLGAHATIWARCRSRLG